MVDSSRRVTLASLRRWIAAPHVWPYALSLLALIALFCVCQPFWLTNDDASMSLIADGGGLVASPSPHLVLTNIAWGYLIYEFPSIGGIRSYTWVTYLALGISYFTLVYSFTRSKLDHRLAAILLVMMYAHAVIYPQFTTVAGYLAAAGLMLGCVSVERRSMFGGAFSGLLVICSGLVRADETLLVLVVAAPLCMGSVRAAWESDQRRAWLTVASTTAAGFIGFQLLDYFTFSSGAWSQYASMYAIRTGFTDFQLGTYFKEHPAALAGSDFSLNDIHLIGDWFYVDTDVFSPTRLSQLLQRVPWTGKLHPGFAEFTAMLVPFSDLVIASLSVFLVVAMIFHKRRGPLLMALALLGLVMVALTVAGRPGITRIYQPVFMVLTVFSIGYLSEARRGWYPLILGFVGTLTILMCVTMYSRNLRTQFWVKDIQAATCSMAHDSLPVMWGGRYPLTLYYPPFEPMQDECALHYYSFGEFSLAPYALDQLHRYTGGKDFVPAVLSGQSFDIIADRGQMTWLRTYFNDHYSTRLSVKPEFEAPLFKVFRVVPVPIAAHK